MSELIELKEYDQREATLTSEEHHILTTEFSSRVHVEEIAKDRYLVKSRQYVGNIVLPKHTIVIRPKIPNLNFFLMLAYASDLMELGEEEFLYAKDRDIFELILNVFLARVDKLVKRGLSKGYIEDDDNLRHIRGRVLVTQELRNNPITHEKIFCRYADFNVDTPENRILRYVLLRLSQMKVKDTQLNRSSKALFRYFDSVSLRYLSASTMPRVPINRLNQHYLPALRLAKLILENSTVNLQQTGDTAFSSFLVDMNRLFEKFLLLYLRTKLKDYVVKGASRLGGPYALDEKREWRRNPDIVIKRRGKPILVMDAKYKILGIGDKEDIDADVDQVLIYTLPPITDAPTGILVYPKCEGSTIGNSEPRKIMETGKSIAIRVVDLTKSTREEFYGECDDFVTYVDSLAKDSASLCFCTS